MNKMKNIQEFNGIITSFQKKYKKITTNCYFMREELTDLIQGGSLYLWEDSGIIYVLCDRIDYYNLYYYLGENGSLPDDFTFMDYTVRNDAPVLLDSIYSRNRQREKNPFISQMLSGRKLQEYKQYQRMAMKLADLSPLDLSYGFPEGYRLRERPSQYTEILSLWKTALDEKSTPLPDRFQLEKLEREELLSCIESIEEGGLCAAATLNLQKNLGLLQHLAVFPNHRRKGLANSLCKRVISQAVHSGAKVLRLWVDTKNKAAITLYEREGFSPDGILCNQYLYKRSI